MIDILLFSDPEDCYRNIDRFMNMKHDKQQSIIKTRNEFEEIVQ
jgi:hypothetical protein